MNCTSAPQVSGTSDTAMVQPRDTRPRKLQSQDWSLLKAELSHGVMTISHSKGKDGVSDFRGEIKSLDESIELCAFFVLTASASHTVTYLPLTS